MVPFHDHSQVRIISSGTCCNVDLQMLTGSTAAVSAQILWSHLQVLCFRDGINVLSASSQISGSPSACSITLHHALVHRSFDLVAISPTVCVVAPPSTSHRPLPMTQDASPSLSCWHIGLLACHLRCIRKVLVMLDMLRVAASPSSHPYWWSRSGSPLPLCVVTFVPSKYVPRQRHLEIRWAPLSWCCHRRP
jgi:hypothetical protein